MAYVSDGRYAESSGYEPQRATQPGEARGRNASMPAERSDDRTPHARRYADIPPEGGPTLTEAMEMAGVRMPGKTTISVSHVVVWTMQTAHGPQHQAMPVDSEELGQLIVEEIGEGLEARVVPMISNTRSMTLIEQGKRLLAARRERDRAQLDAGGAQSKIKKAWADLRKEV